MNYRYDSHYDDAPENSNGASSDNVPDSTAESHIPESYAVPPSHYEGERLPDAIESEYRTEYEQSAPEDWCEASYNEVPRSEEPVFTPGLGAGPFYASPRRDAPRREPPEMEPPRRARRSGGFVRALCLVLVCAVISSATAIGSVYYGVNNGLIAGPTTQVVLGATPQPEVSPVADTDTTPAPSGTILTGQEIYGIATQQVVGVSTEITMQSSNPFYGGGSNSIYGTGFIISEDGYIMTNYHVIETAYEYGVSPQVIMRDGTTYSAKIIGFEASNDVAVLKIDATGLSPVKIGSSADVQPGEAIYAVGNPNQLDYTITDGIVSALDREVQVDSGTGYSITMFQISAAVNSGNSGGPVYNEYGEVIGIVSAKYMSTGTEGLGFAIPIDDAMDIASDLISVGYVTGKAQLGVTVQTMTNANAEYYGVRAGAFVFTVTPGGAADRAGIKPGDIITMLNDTVVTSSDDLKSALSDYRAGDTVTMQIYRDGENLEISVTFDEQGGSAASSQSVDIPSAG